jgi:hypothetical protein
MTLKQFVEEINELKSDIEKCEAKMFQLRDQATLKQKDYFNIAKGHLSKAWSQMNLLDESIFYITVKK